MVRLAGLLFCRALAAPVYMLAPWLWHVLGQWGELSIDSRFELKFAFPRYQATMAALLRMHYGDYAHKIDSDHIYVLASSTSLDTLSW